MKPLGYRNLNPLNIRFNVMNNWKGQTGCHKGFCTFDTMEHGYRAAFVLLLNYIKRGFTTPTEIISSWAPASENNTKAYIATVMRYFNHSLHPDCHKFDADSSFVSIYTPTPLLHLLLFAKAMSCIELGVNPFKDTLEYKMLESSFEQAAGEFVLEFHKNNTWIAIFDLSGFKLSFDDI